MGLQVLDAETQADEDDEAEEYIEADEEEEEEEDIDHEREVEYEDDEVCWHSTFLRMSFTTGCLCGFVQCHCVTVSHLLRLCCLLSERAGSIALHLANLLRDAKELSEQVGTGAPYLGFIGRTSAV